MNRWWGSLTVFLVIISTTVLAEHEVNMWRLRSRQSASARKPFNDEWFVWTALNDDLTDVTVDGCVYLLPTLHHALRTPKPCTVRLPVCSLGHTLTMHVLQDETEPISIDMRWGRSAMVISINRSHIFASSFFDNTTIRVATASPRGHMLSLQMTWANTTFSLIVNGRIVTIALGETVTAFRECLIQGMKSVDTILSDEVALTAAAMYKLAVLDTGCYLTNTNGIYDGIQWHRNQLGLTLKLQLTDLFRCRPPSIESWVSFSGVITLNSNGVPYHSAAYTLSGVPSDAIAVRTSLLPQPYIVSSL